VVVRPRRQTVASRCCASEPVYNRGVLQRRAFLPVLLILASCVDRGPGPQGKKIDPSYVRDNVLKEVPAGIDHVDVDLGGKVTYVGSRLVYPDGRDASIGLAPGGTIRVISYWQVKQPVGRGWKIFRLVRGGPTSADFMNLGPTDIEIGHPLHTWKAGEVIQDAQDITLRPDWRSQTATLYIGLVADGGHQLGDRMAASGPNTLDRAVVARTINVDLTKAPPPQGTVYVPHALGPITIDGIAGEPGWGAAAASPELATADGSSDPVGKALARMTWDEQNLYLFVQISDSDVFSSFKTHDEPIWKQDCVEMFIDADGNRRGYVELQVNPNNTTFDSFFATTRAQPGDEKWDSGMVTAVKVRGTADKGGDADQGWDVEIAIPLAAVKGRDMGMGVILPPSVGHRWRMNVVRVDYRSNGGNPAVASWNRIGYGDFHALDRMLTVVFADSNGSITPGPGSVMGSGSGAGSAMGSGAGSAMGSGAGSAMGSAAVAPGSATPLVVKGNVSAPAAPAADSAAAAKTNRAPAPPTTPAAPAAGSAAAGSASGSAAH
jgi:hypothetical protein